jgi:hypothetical protein
VKKIILILVILVIGGAFMGYRIYTVNLAHSTFENYYKFRGCTELLEKTAAFATCKLADGEVINLIQVNGKWYLEGDGPKVNGDVEAQKPVQLVDGRQCYTYSHEGTATEPYTVSEFMDINIAGNVVTGTKTGTQNGPDMTNGYQGTLKGTLENNTLNLIYSYTVEGSQNKEKEIYRAGLVGLEKLRYPLVEQGSMLVPDTTKDFQILTYARVGCEASN